MWDEYQKERHTNITGINDVAFVKCGYDGFNSTDYEDIEYIGIYDYYCPASNYSVYGSYYSDHFRFVSLRVSKCKNSTTI